MQHEERERLQGRLNHMEKEMEILYQRIETLQSTQPGEESVRESPELKSELEEARKRIEVQQAEIQNMRSREEELGWIGEMKEILNLLELYKREITRLEGELVEKSKVAAKFQELKEEELESLKVRYNDLVDCYNELEENFSTRIRQLRKNVLRICPDKSALVERAFDETMEASQPRVPKDHPAVLEERSEEEEESGERSAAVDKSDRVDVIRSVENLEDINGQIERLKLQLYYYEELRMELEKELNQQRAEGKELMASLEDQLEHALYKNRLLEDNLIEVIRENEALKEEADAIRAKSSSYDQSVDRLEQLANLDRSKDCPNCGVMRDMAQQFVRDNARII